jgi:RHS repeat-associated protein
VTHSYAYDAIGNILQKNGILYYYCNHPIQPASAQNCTGAIHPSAVVATSDGRTYTYDTNSNTATGAGRTFTWNVDNRVSQVIASGGTVSMNYDYTGIRVKKTGPGGTTYFPFSGYEIDPSGIVTKYIRAGVETLAAKKGSEKLFYHNDHLGGVNVITDIFGVRIQLNEYDPWGKVSRSDGTADLNKRFTGKELDPESEIYYYGGRYYHPELAQFVSPDPFVSDPDDPQKLNRYSYVLNNPINYIDPSGYFHRHKTSGGFFSSFFGFFIGAIVTVLTENPVLGGVVGGAVNAGLNGGNIFAGAFIGGVTAGLTNGLLGVGSSDSPNLTKALISTQAGVFASNFAPTQNIQLAQSTHGAVANDATPDFSLPKSFSPSHFGPGSDYPDLEACGVCLRIVPWLARYGRALAVAGTIRMLGWSLGAQLPEGARRVLLNEVLRSRSPLSELTIVERARAAQFYREIIPEYIKKWRSCLIWHVLNI